MANWVHVENNQITGYYDLLPKNWKNVSGLDLSVNNLPFLKSLGWYPVTKQSDSYDDVNYFISGYDYEIREDDVYATYILAEKPPEPVDVTLPEDSEDPKIKFMKELRTERNKRLAESDWTQLVDVQNNFDNTAKFKWSQYRKKLRDIPQVYESADIITLNQVNWPII